MKRARQGRLAVLTGAGLSMQAPTSLPSGPKLMRDVVRAILAGQPVLAAHHRKISSAVLYRNAIPEVVFQDISNAIGSKLAPFFEVLRFSLPNLGHACLAQLSHFYHAPLMTVNFDELTEAALSHKANAMHLHGRVSSPHRLFVRINQIGRGLPTATLRAMQHNISGKTLLVLGYSGNDLDIVRAIESSCVTEVLWIVHPTRAWWNKEHLQAISNVHSVRLVKCDLSTLIALLAPQLQCVPPPMPPGQGVSRMRTLRRSWMSKCASTLSISERLAVAHNLLFFTGRYADAATAALQGTRTLPATASDHRVWLLNGAADAYRRSCRTSDALRTARSALVLKPRGHKYYRASSWNQIGLAQLECKRPVPVEAVEAFCRARSLLDGSLPRSRKTTREAYRIFAAQVRNNLGLALLESKQYAAAVTEFRAALLVKRRTGNLVGSAVTLTNMTIAGYRSGLSRRAVDDWAAEAHATLVRYNARFELAYYLREVGYAMVESGQRRRGMALLKRGMSVSRGYPMHERLLRQVLESV